MEKETASAEESKGLKYVYDFHNQMRDKNLNLVYEGDVTQAIVKVFTAMTEHNMESTDDSTSVKKKVYHVMVECLQNICKHADNPETGLPVIPGQGIFMVSNNEEQYSVTTGNAIANDKIAPIKDFLTKINGMELDEIKTLYKKMIKESRLSEKAGAGLGFIDIVKKTGNKISFHFEPVNDLTSFFILNSTVTRK